jgi:2-dehydropantoate 2-reductase
VAVKHHHLQEAIPALKNRIGKNTIIISVMNGLDSEEYIGSIYGKEKVLYAVSVAIDAVREENRVTYTKEGKLLFGEAENSILTDRVKRVQALFDRAGIVYETPADMIRILWWKFMINVGINQPSAVLRAPYGVFQTSQDAQAIMESAMKEVIAIAKAANVNVSEEDLTDWYPLLASLSPQGKTSMFQDIEARRKTEVEMFAGKVVELGATYGIPTPVNQTLLRMIKVIEEYPIS